MRSCKFYYVYVRGSRLIRGNYISNVTGKAPSPMKANGWKTMHLQRSTPKYQFKNYDVERCTVFFCHWLLWDMEIFR